MKTLKLITNISISILVVSLFNCREPDNSESTRGEFYWRGWIKGGLHTWEINCDAGCTICNAHWDALSYYELSRSKYEDIYNLCVNLPSSRPSPMDTTKHDPVPTGKATIYESNDHLFGHDGWSGKKYIDEKNYISMAVNCSTTFMIRLAAGLLSAYDSVVVIIPSIAWDDLSFNKTTSVLRYKLLSDTTKLKIYSRGNPTPAASPIKLEIRAIDDPSNPVCIGGECFGSEDGLQVVIYEPKVYNDYHVYHHPGYAPTNDEFKNQFNSVLKQAVVEMGNQLRTSQNSSIWDCNGNGKFDLFPGYAFGAAIGNGCMDEFSAMIDNVEEMDRCNGTEFGASFLIEYPIRQNWALISDPIPDGDGTVRFLELEKVEDIGIMDASISIGPFNSPLNHFNIIVLNVIDSNTVMVALRSDSITGLPDIFRAIDQITLYRDGAINGVTKMSCSCSKSDLSWSTHIHEFLHQISSGRLAHVTDSTERDNLMYPSSAGRTGNKLRYRNLSTVLGSQQQWVEMH